ncbi:ribosome-associated translation inhibitor RaiA [Luteimonas sp. MJ204]|uniref:ribosome hibernation-promoting factor, HPF/YfiA family n=1 Tax=Luteimonas TaxID=83614 RepID=UPI0031BB3298
MLIETHGQQMDVTPALRDYVETKLGRLSRLYDPPLQVRTQLSIDKPDHRAEATVSVAGKTLHADARAADMYAAIDLLADKLDRMLVKEKKKMIDHHRRGGNPVRDGEFG